MTLCSVYAVDSSGICYYSVSGISAESKYLDATVKLAENAMERRVEAQRPITITIIEHEPLQKPTPVVATPKTKVGDTVKGTFNHNGSQVEVTYKVVRITSL